MWSQSLLYRKNPPQLFLTPEQSETGMVDCSSSGLSLENFLWDYILSSGLSQNLSSPLLCICLAHAGSEMQIEEANTHLPHPTMHKKQAMLSVQTLPLVVISFVRIQNRNPQITPACNKVELTPGLIFIISEKNVNVVPWSSLTKLHGIMFYCSCAFHGFPPFLVVSSFGWYKLLVNAAAGPSAYFLRLSEVGAFGFPLMPFHMG